MPRDGSYIYSKPFPDTVPDTTIESAVYNGFVNDVATDLNTPRPIVAGGTGANNAHDAMIALSGEISKQLVTNYSSFPFVNGSFYSAPGATDAPNPTNRFAGIYYGNADDSYATAEARDQTTGILYMRKKVSGVWDATWAQQVGGLTDLDAAHDARYVNLTGDTMTGNLGIDGIASGSPAILTMNGVNASSGGARITFNKGGTTHWFVGEGSSIFGNTSDAFAIYSASAGPAIVTEYLTGNTNFFSTTASTSPTTGALTVAGGAGVGDRLFVGGGTNGVTLTTANASLANYFRADNSGTYQMRVGIESAAGGQIATGTSGNSMVFSSPHNIPVHFGQNNVVRMTIGQNTGDVSIASTTASTTPTTGALTVAGGVGVAKQLNVGGTAAASLAHQVGASDASFANIAVHCSTGNIEGLYSASSAGIALGAWTAHPLELRTNNTSRITISAGGIVTVPGVVEMKGGSGGVVTGTNTAVKIVHTGTGTQYGLGIRPGVDNTVAIYFANSSDGTAGTIGTTATTTTYNTSSSMELKEDLKSFDAGSIIDNTNVYDFKWKNADERAFGVIAQQAIAVYPTAVTYLEKENWYGVDYSKYVPVLLQELKALRARVAALEGGATIGAQPAKKK